jgi:hypothetical protein
VWFDDFDVRLPVGESCFPEFDVEFCLELRIKTNDSDFTTIILVIEKHDVHHIVVYFTHWPLGVAQILRPENMGSPLFNQVLQAELWGHHDPEKAKQVRQVWDTVQAHNDHVFESYRRAFEKLDRDREAEKAAQEQDRQKTASWFPAGWGVTLAEPPADLGVPAEIKKPDPE